MESWYNTFIMDFLLAPYGLYALLFILSIKTNPMIADFHGSVICFLHLSKV